MYNQGKSGSTMTEDTDEWFQDNEEYDDSIKTVTNKLIQGETVIVVAIFGTNDAKSEFWGDVKGSYVEEYKAFIQTYLDLGAHHVVIGVPVPYLGDEGEYCDGDGEEDHERVAPGRHAPVVASPRRASHSSGTATSGGRSTSVPSITICPS